jgi:hypothetical protein
LISSDSAALTARVETGGVAVAVARCALAFGADEAVGEEIVADGAGALPRELSSEAEGLEPGGRYVARAFAEHAYFGRAWSPATVFFAEPLPADAVAASAVGADGRMTVAWAPGVGATGTVVVVREDGEPGAPQDGTTYAPGAALPGGAGAVRYAGTGAVCVVTGLDRDRRYTVAAYAYAGEGIAVNYAQSAPTAENANTRVINLLPAGLDFGVVAVGAQTSLAVRVWNSGDARLLVTGGSCGDQAFALAETGVVAVAAGATQALHVAFAPTAAGDRSCLFALSGDYTQGNGSLALRGRAVDGSFLSWAQGQGLAGPGDQLESLFPRLGPHGLGNGLVYAMGRNFTNLTATPVLTLRVTAASAVVETPAQDPDTLPYVLLLIEGASALTPPVNWSALTPVATGSLWRVTLPAPPPQHFFRLRAVSR